MQFKPEGHKILLLNRGTYIQGDQMFFHAKHLLSLRAVGTVYSEHKTRLGSGKRVYGVLLKYINVHFKDSLMLYNTISIVGISVFFKRRNTQPVTAGSAQRRCLDEPFAPS